MLLLLLLENYMISFFFNRLTKALFFRKNETNLDVADGETDKQVHEDDADQDDEDHDHEVPADGEERVAVLEDEVLVLDLPGHHHQSLHHRHGRANVEALQEFRKQISGVFLRLGIKLSPYLVIWK